MPFDWEEYVLLGLWLCGQPGQASQKYMSVYKGAAPNSTCWRKTLFYPYQPLALPLSCSDRQHQS